MRNRPFNIGKKHREVTGPTLAESKFVIGITMVTLVLASGFTYYMAFHFQFASNVLATPPLGTARMELTSPGFTEGSIIPAKYMCVGDAATVLPPLQWSNVPKDTVSFALIVHDFEPRPPNGIDDVLRRIIWNIPVSTTQFREGMLATAELPNGSRQGIGNSTDNANSLNQGPCAQPGVSRQYTFELFALDQILDGAPGTTRSGILKAMDGHILGHGVLTGLLCDAERRCDIDH